MKAFVPIIAMSTLLASTVSGWSGSPSTGDLKVKMKIDQRCEVNPNGDLTLDLGTHGISIKKIENEHGVGPIAEIKVKCTKGTPFSIALDTGSNSSGRRRRMANGTGEFIFYDLYYSIVDGAPWGSLLPPPPKTDTKPKPFNPENILGGYGEAQGEGKAVSATADGTLQGFLVAGRASLPEGGVPIGTYTDTVRVTVNF